MAEPANAAQIDYWNAAAGQTWAQFQAQLDRQIEPLGLEALRLLAIEAGERVLDIGCGCGQTSIDIASRIGHSGEVVGVDISQPMLQVARTRPIPPGVVRPTFLQADAQADDLGLGRFDAAFSRFGVMFFSDPIAAFANIRRAMRPGGRLGFVCWRRFEENPWLQAPLEAAQPFLPPSPPADPTAPGPFAFAEPDRVVEILEKAGFDSIEFTPFDASIGGAGVEETLSLAFKVGPLGLALRENPQCAAQVADAVRAALTAYDTPQGVLMPAAVWIVRAEAPAACRAG